MNSVNFLPLALLGLLSTQLMAASPALVLTDNKSDSFGLLAKDGIQTKLLGPFHTLVDLPSDGSACDPEVIRQNLRIINQSGVIQGVNLTLTKSLGNMCYGPCEIDVDKAKDLHCEKGELLAQLIEHLDIIKK